MAKEKAMSEARILVEEAAKLMGVSPQFIRVGLQKGIFPWGYAVRITGKRYTYFINRAEFMKKLKGE